MTFICDYITIPDQWLHSMWRRFTKTMKYIYELVKNTPERALLFFSDNRKDLTAIPFLHSQGRMF